MLAAGTSRRAPGEHITACPVDATFDLRNAGGDSMPDPRREQFLGRGGVALGALGLLLLALLLIASNPRALSWVCTQPQLHRKRTAATLDSLQTQLGPAVMLRTTRKHWLISGLGLCAFLAGQAMAADVYQGTASFKNKAGKKVTATVTITLDRTMPDEERMAVAEQVKANPDSAKSVLAGKPQLGTIEADDKSVPIRFASGYALDEGQNVIVLSDEPMGFIGGSRKSKKGFDLTYAMISMKASGAGKGEIRPAARIKWMESGAPAPVGYDNQIVWIENVTKTTKP